MFDTVMIVYEPSEQRRENFTKIKRETIPNIQLFSAIDSVQKYDECMNMALMSNILTKNYIDSNKNIPGKLGCNLSHIYVLKQFIEKSDKQWLLVLEDDIVVNAQYDPSLIQSLIKQADVEKSEYIQLYTNHRYFLSKQLLQEKVGDNLYRMISQWHTCAYLIHKEGALKILSYTPLNDNIDHIFSKYIRQLKSLCYINSLFDYRGALEGSDKDSEFGSIINNSHIN